MRSRTHRGWLVRAFFAGVWLLACDPARRDAPSPLGPQSTHEGQPTISTFEASRIAPDPTTSSNVSADQDVTSEHLATTSTEVTTRGKLTTNTRTKTTTTQRGSSDVNPAPEPALSTAVVQGPVHTGEGFRVYLQTTSPIVLGQTQPITIVMEPQAPYKSNDKYPYRFAGMKAQGVTLSAESVTTANVSPERTTLQVNATGTSTGQATLSGTLSFSVCTAERCLVERASLTLKFQVAAPN